MNNGYEMYCVADPRFYDSPVRERRGAVDFEAALRPAPAGWCRDELGDCVTLRPQDVDLPAQGWKIHASVRGEDAEALLEAVWRYCVERRIAFKFVRGRRLLFLRNVKYAPRNASGKFVTIYPADERQLQTVLEQLGEQLAGMPGPYILSDLRWGEGPLYVRYGGFVGRYRIDADGKREPAIEDADGRLVPDRRGTTFQIPDHVALPACLEPHLKARANTTIADLPYRIDGALHFSNGGGVYHGVELQSGERVVLKEARPHAGLSIEGEDAVARLQRERELLERLAGLDVVPRLRDHLVIGEHHFLVEDFVDGPTLHSLILKRCPLLDGPDDPAAADYVDWAIATHGRLERAVEAIHERGVVVGDLHPANVLVRPDGGVVLIDLEVASRVDEQRRPTLANPGFAPPAGVSGVAADRYALACLRLHCFLPLTTLLTHGLSKAADLAEAIAELFPVPADFLSQAVGVIASADQRAPQPSRKAEPPLRLEPTSEGWVRARDSIAAAILASATPERDDRLFPGDIKQFQTNGLNLAYGAAGVLHALHATGAGRYPEHEQWLVARATDPPVDVRLGLYDGLYGVAYALDTLGRHEDALQVLDACAARRGGDWARLSDDLAGGLPGIALTLAHFARQTGDESLWSEVWTIVDVLAERLGDVDDVPQVSGGAHPHAGLLRGASRRALLFVRLYEQTGEARLLELAATAIRQDLRRCTPGPDGALRVNEGWRANGYLADGSAGIGLVIAEYLAQRDDPELAAAERAIRPALSSRFYVSCGLMFGRAGMLYSLSHVAPAGSAERDQALAEHVRRLGLHAVDYRGELAFPGQALLRLSMDLATGSAGILLALGAALHDQPVALPFLVSTDVSTTKLVPSMTSERG